MTNFGALKIGDYFSTFNVGFILRKIDERHAVATNGHVYEFKANQTVCKVR